MTAKYAEQKLIQARAMANGPDPGMRAFGASEVVIWTEALRQCSGGAFHTIEAPIINPEDLQDNPDNPPSLAPWINRN